MSEILDGNYKINKFPIGSVIESDEHCCSDKLVIGFKTKDCGVGIYELDFVDDDEMTIDRFEFTQEYVESVYHLKEGKDDEN